MDETLAKILRIADEQIERERQRAAQRGPSGDRRLQQNGPPQGVKERRSGQERRNRIRSPRAGDDEEK